MAHIEAGTVRALAIEGGAVKIISALGALAALEAEGRIDWNDIEVFVGTSSGAVACALLAVGWPVDELAGEMIYHTSVVGDILDVKPSTSFFYLVYLIWRKNGINSGDAIYRYFGDLLSVRTGDPDITFHEVWVRYGKHLMVTASCYTDQQMHLFSDVLTPSVPVRKALRATTSVVGLYVPIVIDDKRFYDGAHMCNNPLRLVDEHYPALSDHTISLRYDDSCDAAVASNWNVNPIEMLANVINMMSWRITHLDRQLTRDAERRTLTLPTNGVTLARVPTEHELEQLYRSGYRCVVSEYNKS